ncbi:hypothetical protein BFJ66_g9124 [Fusarium oxysporum f. sp. cepae]|uniref:Uncharacterized protein n=2 Tax=Fusarium oxysporum TaxID=5507 RepID=A0A3L6MVX7_FUSOX|nr:hypothetical protein FOZG_15687 [Fusarium oxysporum Fo47]RKK08645.1 hypothetical protein BFJ65_g16307 [Fusarium oxysporum f. sp. cepae]RKK37069.1 hypothetical protein BFJ67_g12522 [Fusarium oxysporum f. sp. cepae]RKK45358.1 hypothetical protein BFJ66_g9124 [Fusarium oxysporum f. sp. cepae]RKK88682.1 hypothetical protein BFJ71_g12839 [Fusarium oxysporum]
MVNLAYSSIYEGVLGLAVAAAHAGYLLGFDPDRVAGAAAVGAALAAGAALEVGAALVAAAVLMPAA